MMPRYEAGIGRGEMKDILVGTIEAILEPGENCLYNQDKCPRLVTSTEVR